MAGLSDALTEWPWRWLPGVASRRIECAYCAIAAGELCCQIVVAQMTALACALTVHWRCSVPDSVQTDRCKQLKDKD